MKAILYRAFGPARDVLQIEEVQCPPPAEGELRVDLAYSGVNPSDVKARAGARAGVTRLPWPEIIPHSDGAGTVSAVGSGVDPARIGQRVWLWNGQWQRALGTAAEQITVPQDQAVPLPDNISMEAGAVLGIPGLTAFHTVFSSGDVSGQTVLVHGGAGMVGGLAIQAAKWGGATVIATCSPAARAQVLALGADAALDYASTNLAADILEATGGQLVDRIIEVEFGANAATDAEVIAEGGHIAAYGSAKDMQPTLPFYPLMFKNVTLEMALVYILKPAQRRAAETRLAQALTDGGLTIPTPDIYQMADAAAAHEAVERGGRKGPVMIRTGSA